MNINTYRILFSELCWNNVFVSDIKFIKKVHTIVFVNKLDNSRK